MMDWTAFGVVAACAWGGLLLALGVGKSSSLRSLRLCVSALKQKPLPALVFLAFAALATVEAQKRSELRVENGELRVEMRRGEAAAATLNSQLSTLNSARVANHDINPAPLTDADIDRGYLLVDEDDSAAAIEIPTNAVTVGNWHLHGASSNFGNHRLDLSPWSFPMGTNGASFSAFWYFVEGKVRPTPRDAAHEICAVGVPMLAMQGASCLWLSAGADDSRTIIWDSFFLNGDTNAPVTAQVTLWPDGAFAAQSNNLRRVYARIDPRDWDGDGLANEIDPAPKSHDGDCFGTGEAWWAANLRAVAATNALPEAYYTLAFTATADRTRIAVTCDGASDLGDFVILANAGQTCEVPLLKGANYAVRADAPLTDVALGDENAHVVSFAPEGFDITYPLDCSFARSGDDYSLTVAPTIPGLTLASLSGGCCALNVTANGFSWTCADTCTCDCHEHWLDAVLTWEGYSRSCGMLVPCDCFYKRLANPLLWLSLSLPRTVIVDGDVGGVTVTFSPPVATNGNLSLRFISGGGSVILRDESSGLSSVSLPQTWSASSFSSTNFCVEGIVASAVVGDVALEWEYAESNGDLHSVTQTMSVAEIRHETVFATPACRERTLLGVGESVLFFFKPHQIVTHFNCTSGEVTEPSPYQQWSDAGAFVETDMDAAVFTASHTAAVSCVTMDVGGCSQEYAFTIVEPEGFHVESVDHVYYDNNGHSGLFDLTFNNLLMPTNVSFGMIQVMEVPMVATNAVGYYAQPSKAEMLDHGKRGAGRWRNVGVNNRSDDFVRAGYNAPPWLEGGSFTWPIPVAWRVYGDEGVTNVFTQTDQRFELDADGTARVRKFGYCGERTTNSAFRIEQEEP